MAEDPGQDGAWIGLREAAGRLGVSEKSVRRRIKAGALRARRVDGPYGPAWQVWVSANGHALTSLGGPDGEGPGSSSGTLDDPGGEGGRRVYEAPLIEALRTVEKLQQQNLELAGRVGYLQAELSQARERILALEAPKGPETATETPPVSEAASEPATRRWWAFWR